jgi:HEAT repeat protein
VLATALRDGQCRERRAIANHLGDFGSRARLAVPALIDALDDGDPGLALEAAGALMRIDHSTVKRRVVPTLIRLLDQANAAGREWKVLRLLGEIGPDARVAAQAICEQLDCGNGHVQREAIEALAKIRPGEECCEALMRVARESNQPQVRAQAAVALWRNGGERAALAVLKQMLREPDSLKHFLAADAIGSIGPGAREALPELRRVLHRKGHPNRAIAAEAYWRIARRVESPALVFDPRQEAVAVLADMAEDSTEEDRAYAFRALGRIGAGEPAAVAALIRLLRDSDADVRGTAAAQLGEVGSASIGAVSALASLWRGDDLQNRRIALLALLQIGGPGETRKALLQQVERRPWLVFRTDHPTRTLGPEAKRFVPYLLRMLRHDERDIYRDAAAVLRQIDPQAADRAGVP